MRSPKAMAGRKARNPNAATPAVPAQAAQAATPALPSRLPQAAAGARGAGAMAMAKGGAVNQHKRLAMGEKVSGMKRGGKVC